MKNKLLIFIIILMLLLSACASASTDTPVPQTHPDNFTKEIGRFVFNGICYGFPLTNAETGFCELVDTKTCVIYLRAKSTSGAMSPFLDERGMPMYDYDCLSGKYK